MLNNGEWMVTFLGGVEAYKFREGGAWKWMEAAAPPTPKVKA